MRLPLTGDRRPGPLQPRKGNRIWLVTCIVTVTVVVFVAVKVTASGCPGEPRAGGTTAAAAGTGPASDPGTGAMTGSSRAASPALARSVIAGHAVFYDPGQAAGSCGLGPFPAGGRYASLPPRGYASGRACGSYVDVHGPRGTVRAEVVDECADCAAGTVDLSRAAFARIADPRTGTVAVICRTVVDPPLPGPLVLRFAPVPRPGALAVQVINHGNRLSSVEAKRAGGRWYSLAPGPDGYWTGSLRPERPGSGAAPDGAAGGGRVAASTAGSVPGGPIQLRITDVAGHQVVVTGVSARSAVLHVTAWMYRARHRTGRRASLPRAPAASRVTGTPTARPGTC